MDDFQLVQYDLDKVWRVCPRKEVRINKRGCMAKWPPNGQWYYCKVEMTGDKVTLEKVKIQKENNLKDKVTLKKVKIQKENNLKDKVTMEKVKIQKENHLQENQKKNRAPQKRHCCFYCQKHLFKIYRHYTDVHKSEEEVKVVLGLPKKSVQRRTLLDKLRKKGDHLFNSTLKNDKEDVIVCRQTLAENKIKREKNLPCPNCLGYYSKLSIRHHIEKCMPQEEKKLKRRNIQAQCRRIENNLHPKASKQLREIVFPVLNEDDITNAVRFDDLIISYANFMCRKYTAEHHAQNIRSNIRAMGRLILAIKEVNPLIKNLIDAFDPKYVDLIIEGINKVAGLDSISHLYNSPATAMLLATELKKICKLREMEYIKLGDSLGRKKMEDLHLLFNLEFQVTVNKTALESQKIKHRRKISTLPNTVQVAKFRIYLEEKIVYFTSQLQKQYSFEDWKHLTEYTLVHLAIFNRKRPGETQRLLIEDYKHFEVVNDADLSNELDILSKEQIKKWARIRFTGKLGKNNALLVHRELGFKAIELILKYRVRAGVNPQNRFIFGEPSTYEIQKTFMACNLIRKFSTESGIENPELLRTRLLRQHLATETARSKVDSRLEGRVSDFMSHHRQIHQDYYVLTQKTDDITQVSTLLEKFSSVNENNSDQQILSTQKVDKKKSDKALLSTRKACDDYNSDFSSDDEDYVPEDSDADDTDSFKVNQNEINYVMGKKQKRKLWSSEEKKKTRAYFHDEIYKGVELSRQKVTKFFHLNQKLLKNRTPHLIMQWIKCEINRHVRSSTRNLDKKERLRWTTPEKELIRSSTDKHSISGTLPSIAECELLLEENKCVFQNRTPEAVKSFVYNCLKKRNSV